MNYIFLIIVCAFNLSTYGAENYAAREVYFLPEYIFTDAILAMNSTDYPEQIYFIKEKRSFPIAKYQSYEGYKKNEQPFMFYFDTEYYSHYTIAEIKKTLAPKKQSLRVQLQEEDGLFDVNENAQLKDLKEDERLVMWDEDIQEEQIEEQQKSKKYESIAQQSNDEKEKESWWHCLMFWRQRT